MSSRNGLKMSTDDLSLALWIDVKSASGSVAVKQLDGKQPLKITFGNKFVVFFFE